MISESTEQTIQVANDLVSRVLPQLAQGPVIISLQGDYGTGKTHFVKGLARALGIAQEIVSPSYVYMRNYPFQLDQIKGELVHIDAWRVKQESDFKLLGVEAFLKPGFIIAIEWPQQYAETLFLALKASGVAYSLISVELMEIDGDKREISIDTTV